MARNQNHMKIYSRETPISVALLHVLSPDHSQDYRKALLITNKK